MVWCRVYEQVLCSNCCCEAWAAVKVREYLLAISALDNVEYLDP